MDGVVKNNNNNIPVLIIVSLLWGVTNPLIRRGSKGLERVVIDVGGERSFLYKWKNEVKFLFSRPSYFIPLIINLVGSALYFYSIGDSDIMLAVPITNSLSLLFTTVMGIYLGEDIVGVCNCITGAMLTVRTVD
jgi:hypothetical protein